MFSRKALGLSEERENSTKDATVKLAGNFQLNAIKNGALKAAKSQVSTEVFVPKKIKQSELHKATEKGLLNVVKAVIRDDDSLISSHDENGFCPLHIAAIHNRTHVLQELLDFGADVDVLSIPDGVTPLHVACRY